MGQMAGKTLFEGVMAYATLGLGEAYVALRTAKSTRAITSAVDDGANIAKTVRYADDFGFVDDFGADGLGKAMGSPTPSSLSTEEAEEIAFNAIKGRNGSDARQHTPM